MLCNVVHMYCRYHIMHSLPLSPFLPWFPPPLRTVVRSVGWWSLLTCSSSLCSSLRLFLSKCSASSEAQTSHQSAGHPPSLGTCTHDIVHMYVYMRDTIAACTYKLRTTVHVHVYLHAHVHVHVYLHTHVHVHVHVLHCVI